MARGKPTKWTTELIDEYLKENYPWVYLIPGQEYITASTKMWFYCTTPGHGYYQARWHKVSRIDGINGCQCPRCHTEKVKTRNFGITAAFVGQTTKDGLKILEHVGYQQSPSHKKMGKSGRAIYRFLCPVCGSDHKKEYGNNLKRPGHITHCGCLSKRDSRNTFTKQKAKAEKPCFFYIFSTIGGSAKKIGISENIKRRVSKSYEQELFVSAAMPRAHAWAIEQVMLYQLRRIGLQFDLTDLPAFEGKEAGGSEVLVSLELEKFLDLYRKLSAELDELGWEGLLDAYIPEPDMNNHQRFRWDGDRMEVVSGEKFKGHIFNSVFDI